MDFSASWKIKSNIKDVKSVILITFVVLLEFRQMKNSWQWNSNIVDCTFGC